jgi:hypothetical protein
MTRHITLQCDYTADPLWSDDGAMIKADRLPLSRPLINRLRAWAAVYDGLMKTGFRWRSRDAYDAFITEGRNLLPLVQAELGEDFEVELREDPWED